MKKTIKFVGFVIIAVLVNHLLNMVFAPANLGWSSELRFAIIFAAVYFVNDIRSAKTRLKRDKS